MNQDVIETFYRINFLLVLLSAFILFLSLICFYFILTLDRKFEKIEIYFNILLKERLTKDLHSENKKLNFKNISSSDLKDASHH